MIKPAQLTSLVPSAKQFIQQRGGEVYAKDFVKAYGQDMLNYLTSNKIVSQKAVQLIDKAKKKPIINAVVIKLLSGIK